MSRTWLATLTPIFFKFYLHDIAVDKNEREDVELFKFADDRSVIVHGKTTPTCLETLKIVCDSLHGWSSC